MRFFVGKINNNVIQLILWYKKIIDDIINTHNIQYNLDTRMFIGVSLGFHWNIMGAHWGKNMQYSTLVWHIFYLLRQFLKRKVELINTSYVKDRNIQKIAAKCLANSRNRQGNIFLKSSPIFLNHKTKFILPNNLIEGYTMVPKIHKQKTAICIQLM